MKRFIQAALCAAMLSIAAIVTVAVAPPLVVALAQTTVTTPAPSSTTPAGATTVTTSGPETTVNVGQLLAPWLQGIIAGVVSVIMACFGWLTVVINKRAGLEGNAAVLQIEAHLRELLETALTNAAGWVVMAAGPKLNNMNFDVKSPLVVQAVMTINNLAGAAVIKFGLTPDDLAKKLIAKIGVLTASNAAVVPTTTVSAPST